MSLPSHHHDSIEALLCPRALFQLHEAAVFGCTGPLLPDLRHAQAVVALQLLVLLWLRRATRDHAISAFYLNCLSRIHRPWSKLDQLLLHASATLEMHTGASSDRAEVVGSTTYILVYPLHHAWLSLRLVRILQGPDTSSMI